MKKEFNGKIGVEIRDRRRSYGFHWIGRDKTGVSRWEGDRGAMKWGALVLGIIGGTMLAVGAGIFFLSREIVGSVTMCAAGLIQLGLAFWGRRLHRRLTGLLSVEEVAETTRVDRDTLEAWTKSQNLKPQAMLNGQYLYEASDFGEDATLLRPSDEPNEEFLLRSAKSAETDNENLLRPASSDQPITFVDDSLSNQSEEQHNWT